MTVMVEKSIPSLGTERLVLRPFGLEDAAEVKRLVGDRDVAEMTVHIPHPYKEGMAEEWISWHKDDFSGGRGVTFAVEIRNDNRLIGAISLRDINEREPATLGYWIGKPYWNRGFCTEAARRVVDYAFTELGLIAIQASYLTRNPASERVMQKMGMRYLNTQRRYVEKWKRHEEFAYYILTKSEWSRQAAVGQGRSE